MVVTRGANRGLRRILSFTIFLGIFHSIDPASAVLGAGEVARAVDDRDAPSLVVPASVVSGPSANQRRLRLGLLLIDAARLAPGTSAALEAEVTALLADAGIDAHIVDAQSNIDPPTAEIVLKVVLLDEDGRRFGVSEMAMGANLFPAARPSDTVYVFVPTVVDALDTVARPAATLTRGAIGRALGRVVVHETVHALVPELDHSDTGIMKAVLNLRDLLAPVAYFDATSTAALHYAVRTRQVAPDGGA